MAVVRIGNCCDCLCLADLPLVHLAAILSKDEKTAGQFREEFSKKYKMLAPFSKTETVAVPTTGLRTVASLKPKYHCLSCTEVCLSSKRAEHTAATGHAFCKPVVSDCSSFFILTQWQISSLATALSSVRNVSISSMTTPSTDSVALLPSLKPLVSSGNPRIFHSWESTNIW